MMPPNADTLSHSNAFLYSLHQRRAGGDAAGIGVLHDHHGRRPVAEFGEQLQRGIGVVQIVVGKLLALHLLAWPMPACGPVGT
jgi:hypothetical protein